MLKVEHGHDGKPHARGSSGRLGVRWRRTAAGVAMALIAAAVHQQLRRPASERDWHGTLGGVVPYDLRPPTLTRLKESLWAPEDQRLLLPRAAGVGWSPNLGRIAVLLQGWRPTDE